MSDCSGESTALDASSAKLLDRLKQHTIKSRTRNDGQLWKQADQKAQKSGTRRGVFWVKTKQERYENTIVQQNKQQRQEKKWQTGSSYAGEWKNNAKHGFGSLTWANGNKYEGDFENDKRSGHGTFWICDKTTKKLRKVYTGTWRNDLKEGLGAFYFKNRARYEGDWSMGLRHGNGKLFASNGDVYEGQWREGRRSGQGRLALKNGDQFVGEWLADKKEGPGQFFHRQKRKVFVGEWVADVAKCGVFADAEFIDESEDTSSPFAEAPLQDQSNPYAHMPPIPKLKLKNPDDILRDQIAAIRVDREVVRSVPHMQWDELFPEEVMYHLGGVYAQADQDGNGAVKSTELKALFEMLETETSDLEIAQLMVDLDKDANGTISFPEFVRGFFLIDQQQQQQPSSQSSEEGQPRQAEP